MVRNWLIIFYPSNHVSNILSGQVVGRDVVLCRLRSKNELCFLHFRFQLCSIDCTCVRSKLLMSLTRVRFINWSLIGTSYLKVTLSQIRAGRRWCVRDHLSILSRTATLIGALKTLWSLWTGCNTAVRNINITCCHRNFFNNFYRSWFTCCLGKLIFICSKLEMCLSELFSV
jgi:hypothetical protein